MVLVLLLLVLLIVTATTIIAILIAILISTVARLQPRGAPAPGGAESPAILIDFRRLIES